MVRQQGGNVAIGNYVSPLRFNQAIDFVNKQLFADYRVQYEKGIPMADEVRTFIERKGSGSAAMIDLTAVNGVINGGSLPSDYAYYISSGYLYQYKPDCDTDPVTEFRQFEYLPHSDFEARLSSQLQFPTITDPICCVEGTQILVAPVSIDTATLTYFRLPVTPYWDYTIVNTKPVYDAAGSTDFEWPDACLSDIVNRIVLFISKGNLNDLGIKTAQISKP
jgi:hypothetical protein